MICLTVTQILVFAVLLAVLVMLVVFGAIQVHQGAHYNRIQEKEAGKKLKETEEIFKR